MTINKWMIHKIRAVLPNSFLHLSLWGWDGTVSFRAASDSARQIKRFLFDWGILVKAARSSRSPTSIRASLPSSNHAGGYKRAKCWHKSFSFFNLFYIMVLLEVEERCWGVWWDEEYDRNTLTVEMCNFGPICTPGSSICTLGRLINIKHSRSADADRFPKPSITCTGWTSLAQTIPIRGAMGPNGGHCLIGLRVQAKAATHSGFPENLHIFQVGAQSRRVLICLIPSSDLNS